MTEQPPLGRPLPEWTPRPFPPVAPIDGRWCRLEPLDPQRHAAALHAANSEDIEGRMWAYLGVGPFADLAQYRAWVESAATSPDPRFFAIIDREDGRPKGVASLLRIDPPNGVIEVGHIAYSPSLQRTRAATDAMYVLMRLVFDDLGYRRYEWKCNDLNAPSRAAAERLGFIYEGTFRQAKVDKGRNRDTAWFSILDSEWPARRAAFERWLDPVNFDAHGRQLAPLQR
jgi:RimJ/RimL family protein N-acetyltransferase